MSFFSVLEHSLFGWYCCGCWCCCFIASTAAVSMFHLPYLVRWCSSMDRNWQKKKKKKKLFSAYIWMGENMNAIWVIEEELLFAPLQLFSTLFLGREKKRKINKFLCYFLVPPFLVPLVLCVVNWNQIKNYSTISSVTQFTQSTIPVQSLSNSHLLGVRQSVRFSWRLKFGSVQFNSHFM